MRIAICLCALLACGPTVAQEASPEAVESGVFRTVETEPLRVAQAAAPDHTAWTTIVSTYVRDGRFDYSGLAAHEEHRALMEAYRQQLASTDPAGLTREQQLAFWINAYNVNVIKGVLDNLENEAFAGVLTVEGFFDAVTYTAGGETLTLNDIENERIRAVFGEPRIHFAVNCASIGCPPLRAEAYTADALEAQLEEQTVAFLRATTSYDANTNTVSVSQLFEWFAGDFEASGGVRAFVAARLEGDLAAAVSNEANTIAFTTYDWDLNAPPE